MKLVKIIDNQTNLNSLFNTFENEDVDEITRILPCDDYVQIEANTYDDWNDAEKYGEYDDI